MLTFCSMAAGNCQLSSCSCICRIKPLSGMYGKGRYTVFAWAPVSVFLMFDICITFNLLNLFLIWDVKAPTFPKCQQLASILDKVVDDFATGSGIQQGTTPFSTTLITRLRFVSSQAIWVAAGHDHLLHLKKLVWMWGTNASQTILCVHPSKKRGSCSSA